MLKYAKVLVKITILESSQSFVCQTICDEDSPKATCPLSPMLEFFAMGNGGQELRQSSVVNFEIELMLRS